MLSNSIKNWLVKRWSATEVSPSRLLAIESISSKKIIDGALNRAALKRDLSFFSLPPTHRDVSSAQDALKKQACTSEAVARAIIVLPVPGGPYSINPLLRFAFIFLKSAGNCMGITTASRMISMAREHPIMSSNFTFVCFNVSHSVSSYSSLLLCLLLDADESVGASLSDCLNIFCVSDA